MKHSFYDVKLREKVEAEVTEKVEYLSKRGSRFAFKGKSATGGNLTAFVNQAKYLSLTDMVGKVIGGK